MKFFLDDGVASVEHGLGGRVWLFVDRIAASLGNQYTQAIKERELERMWTEMNGYD